MSTQERKFHFTVMLPMYHSLGSETMHRLLPYYSKDTVPSNQCREFQLNTGIKLKRDPTSTINHVETKNYKPRLYIFIQTWQEIITKARNYRL